jgi:hypothetical protein
MDFLYQKFTYKRTKLKKNRANICFIRRRLGSAKTGQTRVEQLL